VEKAAVLSTYPILLTDVQARDHWDDLGSDPLHLISAKLLRRVHKFEKLNLGHCLQPHWVDMTREDAISAHNFVVEKWTSIEAHAKNGNISSVLQSIQPAEDLNIAFPNLDEFLATIKSRETSDIFNVFKPPLTFPFCPPNELPIALVDLSASSEHKYFCLAALEIWVEKNHRSWIESNKENIDTCGKLRKLMETYKTAASIAYAGVTTAMSIMYLTLTELWVMCDKSACYLYPPLEKYNPEICLEEFQSLCLPLRSQMQRLKEAEDHVRSRSENAIEDYPSIYCDFGHVLSFAVCYFDKSPVLQALKSSIELDARKKREAKLQEFASLKQQYQGLMERYELGKCEREIITAGHNARRTYLRAVFEL
jgi:hypothetical protein